MSLFGLAISMASKNPTTADSGDVGQSENEVDSIQFSTQNDNLNGGNAGVKRSAFHDCLGSSSLNHAGKCQT